MTLNRAPRESLTCWTARASATKAGLPVKPTQRETQWTRLGFQYVEWVGINSENAKEITTRLGRMERANIQADHRCHALFGLSIWSAVTC